MNMISVVTSMKLPAVVGATALDCLRRFLPLSNCCFLYCSISTAALFYRAASGLMAKQSAFCLYQFC